MTNPRFFGWVVWVSIGGTVKSTIENLPVKEPVKTIGKMAEEMTFVIGRTEIYRDLIRRDFWHLIGRIVLYKNLWIYNKRGGPSHKWIFNWGLLDRFPGKFFSHFTQSINFTLVSPLTSLISPHFYPHSIFSSPSFTLPNSFNGKINWGG